MTLVEPRKVKILEETTRTVTLLFVDHQYQIQVPRQLFQRRLKLGQYQVINPGTSQPVL